jgi:hypothetical protein
MHSISIIPLSHQFALFGCHSIPILRRLQTRGVIRTSLALLLVALSPPLVHADPEPMAPQTQPSFTEVAIGAWKLDWNGVAGRTYFIQTSTDLVTWHFQPVMAFGEDLWSTTLGSSSPKYFVRLFYCDDPSVQSLEQAMNADFDNDGVSNIDEITILGTNPFLFSTNGSGISDGLQDWDNDGISNADEVALGLDPGTANTGGSTGSATVEYSYDDTNRLIGVTSPVTSKIYQLDAEGNIEGQ